MAHLIRILNISKILFATPDLLFISAFGKFLFCPIRLVKRIYFQAEVLLDQIAVARRTINYKLHRIYHRLKASEAIRVTNTTCPS